MNEDITIEYLHDRLTEDLAESGAVVLLGEDELGIKTGEDLYAVVTLEVDETGEDIAVISYSATCPPDAAASLALCVQDYIDAYVGDELFEAYRVTEEQSA